MASSETRTSRIARCGFQTERRDELPEQRQRGAMLLTEFHFLTPRLVLLGKNEPHFGRRRLGIRSFSRLLLLAAAARGIPMVVSWGLEGKWQN